MSAAASARSAPRRDGAPDVGPGAAYGILRRDARLLFRDWVVLSDVLVSAALWTLFPLVGLSLHAQPAPDLVRVMLVTLATALGSPSPASMT